MTKWLATNKTNKVILITDLNKLPAIKPAETVDLLVFHTISEISASDELSDSVRNNKIFISLVEPEPEPEPEPDLEPIEKIENDLQNHIDNTSNPHAGDSTQASADASGSAQSVQSNLDTHASNTDNPHSITAQQAGADSLGSADTVQSNLNTHTANVQNPHTVTKEQINLDNVENLKTNLAAELDPSPDDDFSQGYSIGSRWFNIVANKEFVCLKADVGLALWIETTLTAELTMLDSLLDVELTSVADNEIFIFKSSSAKWTNNTFAEAGISAVGHTHAINIIEDTSPELGGELDALDNAIGFTQQVITSSGGLATINWTSGNKAAITLTENITFTFNNPSNVANLLIKITQDSTGSRTITWPSEVQWVGGVVPTLTTAGDSIDIVSFYFDGTNYFSVSSLDFS
tara:strand:- start:9344 stop:10558 length:1215 start_codon:yes stop_codon:yes gene_type:complete